MNRLCLMLIILALAAGMAQAEWTFLNATDRILTQIPDARAVAWGDVDNDGDPDLFVGGSGSFRGILYENDGGILRDRTQQYGLSNLYTFNAYGAQFVDFDQDGYLDLLLLMNNSYGFTLLRQQPNHRFQAMLNSTHVVFNDPVLCANWFDADGDNKLDLVLSNGTTQISPPLVIAHHTQELVENRDNNFMQLVRRAGAIAVEDFDQDGDADVFVGSSGDADSPARLFRKTPSGYTDCASDFAIPATTGRTGAVWFDYNNDQQLDLFTIGSGEDTYLMRGKAVNGVRGLVPMPCPELFTITRDARYVHAIDADMDGWTDLFFIKSGVPGWALMKNDRGQGWIDVTSSVGLNLPYPATSCAWADWDNDGDLDLAIANCSDGVHLFANQTERRHEYILLNLVSSQTQTPLRGCMAWMQFETAKAVGSTYLRTASMGCDASSVLFVNSSNYKSGEVRLHVNWPNGVQRVYTQNELTLNTTCTLMEPVSGPEEPTTGESATSIQPTVSPNPFNPTTRISYTLPEAVDVKLQVYNLTGQEVATLVSGPQAAGIHHVTFNAADLPTGLYFSRLTVGGESRINRLLLTK